VKPSVHGLRLYSQRQSAARAAEAHTGSPFPVARMPRCSAQASPTVPRRDTASGPETLAPPPAYSTFAPPSEAVASTPLSPIVSTTDDGTITIAPRSLIASYSIFIARKCSATGLF